MSQRISDLIVQNSFRFYNGTNLSGYFYSDTAGRVAYTGGDFYIQTGVSNYYNYATNQYIGNTDGDNIFFRGNTLSGSSWTLTGSGNFTTSGTVNATTGLFDAMTVDGGTNTTVTVQCDSAGEAEVNIVGGGQGTGILYVGQDINYGGGIEYNGDNSPVTSGAGSDSIVLFRRSAGTTSWTARNSQANNNWEFRGDVKAPTFTGALSGNAATATWADTVDVNTSSSSSWYSHVWHSGDTVYSTNSGLMIQPSTKKTSFNKDSITIVDDVHDITTSGRQAALSANTHITSTSSTTRKIAPILQWTHGLNTGYRSVFVIGSERTEGWNGGMILAAGTNDDNADSYFKLGHDGNITYHGESSATVDWTFWHTGNDGAGSGLDADTVDGKQATSLLKSDEDDWFSGSLTSTSRHKGIFGSYDSYKTDHIWSMGTAYRNASDGSDFGNLYGFAYKHTNNPTGGTMAGGHQAVWCTNGNPKAALGDSGIWTNGRFTGANATITGDIILGSGVTLSEGDHRADMLHITGSTSTWAGITIDNTASETLWSLMADGNTFGIYDDTSNIWSLQAIDSGQVILFHNNSAKLTTLSSGVDITGTLSADAISSTGKISVTHDDGVQIRTATNGAGAKITFSDNQGGSYAQVGTIEYKHSDGAVGSSPVTSNDGFIIRGSEANTLVNIQGYLEVDNSAKIGTGGVLFNDTNAYWLSTATNWGLYWDTSNNQLEFHGSGTNRASVDLDNGNIWTDGTLSADGITSDNNLTVTGTSYFNGSIGSNVRVLDGKGLGANVSGGTHVAYPGGGSFRTTSSAHTGAIKIKLPTGSKSQSDMLSFEVTIFDYAWDESVKLFIYGYQYGTTNWTNTSAKIICHDHNKDYTVRFGYDGTSHCVWIGELSSTWSYPQITVTNVNVGYSASTSNYDDGWAVSIVTSWDSIVNTKSNNTPIAKSVKVDNRQNNVGNIEIIGTDGFGNLSRVPITYYSNGTSNGSAIGISGLDASVIHTQSITVEDAGGNSYMDLSGIYDHGNRVYSAAFPPPGASNSEGGLKFERLFLEDGRQALFGLDKAGRVWAWGNSETYNMGQGEGSPTTMVGFKLVSLPYQNYEVVDIIMHGYSTLIFAKDIIKSGQNGYDTFTAFGAGEGSFGFLGSKLDANLNPTFVDRMRFEVVHENLLEWWTPQMSYGGGYQGGWYFRKTDNNIYYSGRRTYGATGDGQVGTCSSEYVTPPSGYTPSQVNKIWNFGGTWHYSYLRTTDNKLWFTGWNGNGQGGIGNTTNQTSWVQVSAGTNEVSKIIDFQGISGYHNASSHATYGAALFLTSEGKLYSCGRGSSYGVNGISSSQYTIFTLAQSSVEEFSIMNIGVHYLKKTDGSVRFWGYDHVGCYVSTSTGLISYDIDTTPASFTAAEMKFGQQTAPTHSFTRSGYFRTYNRWHAFWWPNGAYYLPTENRYGHAGDGTVDVHKVMGQGAVEWVPITSEEQIVQFVVYDYYTDPTTFALTDKGNLYACGTNRYNQMPTVKGGDEGTDTNSTWTQLN